MGDCIYRFFKVWGMLPWRKPLAMVSGISVVVIMFGAWITGRDIPLNACDLGKWYVTVILGAAYGSSTIEAISASGKALKKNDMGGYGYVGTDTGEYTVGGSGESANAGNRGDNTSETG